MSEYSVKLDNMETYAYLMSYFKMTPEEALQEMKEHNQDTTAVEKAIAMAKKQKGE